jgi:hypothetical protein
MLRHLEISAELWFHCVLTLVDQSGSSGLGLFATGLKPASGTHMCRSLAPATIQCRVNWQIGLEYLGTEVPLCLNTPIGYEGFVCCLTSAKLQNLKGDAKLLRSLEREGHWLFSSQQEGRVVKKSRIHKFKYLHTRFSVPRKEERLVNKSRIHKIYVSALSLFT